MTDDTVHPITVHARALAGDYPLLLARAGHPAAVQSGTIGRQPNVHAIPGGVQHHDLSREVSDTVWGYVRLVDDLRDLNGNLYRNAVMDNARRVAVHAEALDPSDELADRLGGDPCLPCAGHSRAGDDTGGRWHPDVAAHLRCLAHRVRLHLEPPGAREFVGPCPSPLVDNGSAHSTLTCGADVRARDGQPGRCTAGHVHDTATVRHINLTAADGVLMTLEEAADRASRFRDRPVRVQALRQRVKRGTLSPVYPSVERATPAYYRWADVRAALALT